MPRSPIFPKGKAKLLLGPERVTYKAALSNGSDDLMALSGPCAMTQVIDFEGEKHEFPDDAKPDEIRAALMHYEPQKKQTGLLRV